MMEQNNFYILEKTFAELTQEEIQKLHCCCLINGMMKELLFNLQNGYIQHPEKIRIAMLLDKQYIAAWMLMDCAGEYNEELINGCSIHFFTMPSMRKIGLAKKLFKSQLNFLENQPALYAYVKSGSSDRAFEFYKKLNLRFGVIIMIVEPRLYLQKGFSNVIFG